MSAEADETDGPNVEQQRYVEDGNYIDEWNLYLCENGTEAFLLGIEDSSGGHDHVSSLVAIQNELFTLGYNSINFQYVDVAYGSDVVSALKQARVFVFRGHGAIDIGNMGTNIILNNEWETTLSSRDIYDFTNNKPRIDLEGCDLMLFIACHTAEHDEKSLPQAAVLAGADCAIGFLGNIKCGKANTWTEKFFELLAQGYSVGYSCYEAKRQSNGLGDPDEETGVEPDYDVYFKS